MENTTEKTITFFRSDLFFKIGSISGMAFQPTKLKNKAPNGKKKYLKSDKTKFDASIFGKPKKKIKKIKTRKPMFIKNSRGAINFIPPKTKIISSPSPRALTGLNEVISYKHISPYGMVIDPHFIEQDFGDWVGHDKAELANDDLMQAYSANPFEVSPPNGESVTALFNRVHEATKDYCQRYKDGKLNNSTIFVSAHGGVSRAALALASDAPFAPERLKEKIQRLSICITQWTPSTDQWSILGKNLTLDTISTIRDNTESPRPA